MRSDARFILGVLSAATFLLIPSFSRAGESPYNPHSQNPAAPASGQCSSQQMEMVNGHCVWKCLREHVRNAAGACVCPAGLVANPSRNGACERAQQACPAGQARTGATACAAVQKCEGGREWDAEKGECVKA